MPRIPYTTLVRQIAAMEQEPGVRHKTCSACGTTFPCLPGGCWCASLHLTPATLSALREKYENCLCPACLLPFSQ